MIRRILILFSFMWLFMAITCDNEPYDGDVIVNDIDNCLMAEELTTQALIGFANSDIESYNLLCQAYRDAIENQIEICGDEDGYLQDIILIIEKKIPLASSQKLINNFKEINLLMKTLES